MPPTPDVFEAALSLPEEDRGRLAEQLVESLESGEDADAESAWVVEIERRIQRIEAGQATMLPADEAIARMHRAADRR